jgi:hypothetical protein
MKIARDLPVLLLSAAAVAWPILNAYAGWKEDLAAAINAEHGCAVRELTKVIEREAKGVSFAVATVHCVDGRKFTAGKVENQPFIFEQCDAPGKRACP